MGAKSVPVWLDVVCPKSNGLRLPNNLVLPIDSKWLATELLEQLNRSTDLKEQVNLRKRIERVVLTRAKEAQKYIDPSITTPFSIVVIPDAVYNICPAVNTQTLKQNVVVVSYSLLLPYLLLVFQMILTTSQTVDMDQLNVHSILIGLIPRSLLRKIRNPLHNTPQLAAGKFILQTIEQSIGTLRSEIEGPFSKALTMLDISRRRLRTNIGKISGAFTSIQGPGVSIERLAADKKPQRLLEHAGSPWTKEEETLLGRGFDEGLSIEELVSKHKRTRGAIKSKLGKLGEIQ